MAIARDYRTAGLPPAEMALMALAEKVVRDVTLVTRADIDGLREHGFSEEQIVEIILTATSRSFFSKVVDAMGFEPGEAWLRHTEEVLGPNAFHALMVGRPHDRTHRPVIDGGVPEQMIQDRARIASRSGR